MLDLEKPCGRGIRQECYRCPDCAPQLSTFPVTARPVSVTARVTAPISKSLGKTELVTLLRLQPPPNRNLNPYPNLTHAFPPRLTPSSFVTLVASVNTYTNSVRLIFALSAQLSPLFPLLFSVYFSLFQPLSIKAGKGWIVTVMLALPLKKRSGSFAPPLPEEAYSPLSIQTACPRPWRSGWQSRCR